MREDFARGIDLWLEIDERMPRDPALRKVLRENALENEGYWKIPSGWAEPLTPPVRERLKDMAVPTLLVVGERDHAYTLDVAVLLEREMPRARRVVVPGAGHLVHFEKPSAFNELVLAEIAGTPSGIH
jgi:pimeloyl-ACP methyl ester carboxylesterase